jgi:LPS-assembly lipoprotein
MMKRRATAPACTFLMVATLGLLVGGCGYHLRTWNLEGSVETAKITSNPRNPLAEPLGRALRSAGVALVDSGEADVTIQLLADRSGRRSVSVTDRARAAEYETSLQVQYSVQDRSGAVLSEPRWLRVARIYQVDRSNLVGSSEEQALLQREMVSDLVQQLIRGLNAVISNSAT